jgi:hypothetical protein
MGRYKIAAVVVLLAGTVLFLALDQAREASRGSAQQAQDLENPTPLHTPSDAKAAPAPSESLPPSEKAHDTAGGTLAELDEISADILTSIRPITWKKPTYSGSTHLSDEDQREIIRLVKDYEDNFQKVTDLAFHEETTTLPVGNSSWTQRNVIDETGQFARESVSLDVKATREPLFFNMKGQRHGRSVDLTVSPFGQMGTRTRGESWRVSYMDGFMPKLGEPFLLENGTAVHRNIKCDMEVPELGNLAEKYNLSDVVFTVVETSVTDWWDSLGDSHPDVSAKDTVWYDNRTGMPQIVIREITDEKKRGELEHPYTQVQIIEYAEVEGVFYPKLVEWIGKGYQLRRTTKRTEMRLNGTAIE